MPTHTPFLLAILDGLALNPNPAYNAVKAANTPTLDRLFASCPWTTLTTFGPRVGLPAGQMGNSEVGHLNIGAGRVVEQDLTRINRISSENTFEQISEFSSMIATIKKNSDSALHLIGLVSRGGVHSDMLHLQALLRAAAKAGVSKIRIHCITDGRDRPQREAIHELVPLIAEIESLKIQYPETDIRISTLIGRYFAMDRDNRSDRTEKAYALMVHGHGQYSQDGVLSAIESSYESDITDEFIDAWQFAGEKIERAQGHYFIEDNDALLFFNFRADRMRQIVSRFLGPLPLTLSGIYTLTEYDENYPCKVLFPPTIISNYLGEVLSNAGLTQLRIAETEKYPHVTYFLNGGAEILLEGEERIMVPSPRDVPTYDLKPEMSAEEITDRLLERLNQGAIDCIFLNFANCDMVGHTGNFHAAVKAVETVDAYLGKILSKIEALGGSALITADHGNADQMMDYETGQPHTYHTLHPVPLILFDSKDKTVTRLKPNGALCDIAPTILEYLDIPVPVEMTGSSLLG